MTAMSVNFSYWLVIAGLGGSVSGSAHALYRAWKEGGGLRTIYRALIASGRHVYALLIIDFSGGVLTAVLGWASGATAPERLVSLVNDTPSLGWFLVGLLGPVVAGRLFTGGFVRGRYNEWIDTHSSDQSPKGSTFVRWSEVADQAWRLRSEAVATIEDKVWVIVQGNLGRAAAANRESLEAKLRAEPETAAELERLARSYFDRQRRNMSAEVRSAVDALDGAHGGRFYAQRVERLGHALINGGFWDVIDAFLSE